MGRCKLTHEKQVEAIAKINPNINVLGNIIDNKTPVLCECKICSHRWDARPYNLKRGHGCPLCAGNAKLTHEERALAIAEVNPTIEVLGEITGCQNKVLCRCRICNHKWSPKPNGLEGGKGCPKCAKRGFLSHDYGKLYVMVDDLEVPTIMKVGVSSDVGARKKQIAKSAHKAGVRLPNLCIAREWDGSTDTLHKAESAVHKAFSGYKVNFLVKFNGSTEFFYYRPEVFATIEEVFKKIIESP